MTMKRREFLERSAAAGMAAAIPSPAIRGLLARLGKSPAPGPDSPSTNAAPSPLPAPAHGTIPVAFLISEGAVIIDFCGPWEVFQDAGDPKRDDSGFRLYTVSETTRPIEASGGMKIVPDYTFSSAPPPKVVVIPAQRTRSEAALEWVRNCSKSADVIMSVCTGAFLLAKTGLLSGKAATTHHSSFNSFAMQFPDVRLERGARFVESGNLATAGGLSSGIDLALRVVERYYGRKAAEATAYYMEYQGKGWTDPNSNQTYAVIRTSTTEHPLCVICEMDVDPASAPKSIYQGQTYYFCSKDHKAEFDAAPARYLTAK
jgi:transcriptional regulator GlxA family with amidase domain